MEQKLNSSTNAELSTSAQLLPMQCCVPLIFLDIDGVLNCQTFYQSQQFKDYKEAKKTLRKSVKKQQIEKLEYYASQICKERIEMLNKLCQEINAEIVVSSTWRKNKTVEELQEIFDYCGATFKVISKTESLGYERGIEISKWLKDNIKVETHGVNYYDFFKYAIIDDDSDMLLNQRFNFFQTDNYSGLTPNTCYKIKRFITGRTFGSSV